MKSIHLDIKIAASREIIWKAITDPDLYTAWTSVFSKTSHFVGSWEKGQIIRFLAFNKAGKLDGMVSEIADAVYPSLISIRHLGYIYDGQDDTTSDAVRSWAPAYENYTLTTLSDGETLFELDQDVTDEYYDMFMDLWPKALLVLKDVAERLVSKRIYPCLWFNKNAQEAVDFYSLIFSDIRKFDSNGFSTTFEIAGSKFMVMNGGPTYQVNSAISYYFYSGSEAVLQRIYESLSAGGHILMPLGKYEWSTQYAWVIDRFGVNWQLDIDDIQSKQKIVPTCLFVNKKNQSVKDAISHYTGIFKPSKVILEAPYNTESGMPFGTLLFAQCSLNGYIFNTMSSTMVHDYDFTPGNSFVIECSTQAEIDYYWHKLGDGGHYSRCGWLVDKFGISWQVLPDFLAKLVNDPDKGPKVIQAFMKMQKFDIETLLNI